MKPEIVIDTPDTLARLFADRFAAEARAAIAARGQFSCALPGGSVAETLFPLLVRAPVAWDQVEFFWGDERVVPPEDPTSNFRMAREAIRADVKSFLLRSITKSKPAAWNGLEFVARLPGCLLTSQSVQ